MGSFPRHGGKDQEGWTPFILHMLIEFSADSHGGKNEKHPTVVL